MEHDCEVPSLDLQHLKKVGVSSDPLHYTMHSNDVVASGTPSKAFANISSAVQDCLRSDHRSHDIGTGPSKQRFALPCRNSYWTMMKMQYVIV